MSSTKKFGESKTNNDHAANSAGRVVPIVRVQTKTACCFLGAPGLVHRYALQKMGAPKGIMLDYSLYMRDCLCNEMLFNYIVQGTGSSLAVLKDLANKSFSGPKFITVPTEIIRRNPSYVSRLLQSYGAGLVSEFRVEQKFLDATMTTGIAFDGTIDAGSVVGTHAMVLLGMRRDPNAKKWDLLLQNTWPNMPSANVTLEYFLSADPKLTFVVAAGGVKANDGLPTNTALIAEIYIEGNDVALA